MTETPRKRDIGMLAGSLTMFTIGMLWVTTTLITNIGYMKTHDAVPEHVAPYENHLSLKTKQGDPLLCDEDCVNTYQSMKKHYESDALKAAYDDYMQHKDAIGYLVTPAPDNLELLKKSARLVYHLRLADKSHQEDKAAAGNLISAPAPGETSTRDVITEAEYIDGLIHLYKQYDAVPMATIMLHLFVLCLYMIGSRPWAAGDATARRVNLYNTLSKAIYVVLACSALSLCMVLFSTS